MKEMIEQFVKQVNFNADGLVTTVAQDKNSGTILMLAWQNAESLRLTLEKQEMVYFSRSRRKLWHKGETSGHIQYLHRIAMDCDGDALVAQVTQVGGIACHTGRESCFHREFSTTEGVIMNAPVLKDPNNIYTTDKIDE